MMANLESKVLGSVVGKEQAFVVLMGASAVLLALWMASTVLRQRKLERAAVILALIAALASAYFYIALWGFTI